MNIRINRQARRAILAVLTLLAVCREAAADDRTKCLERDGPQSAEACSRVIATGELSGKDLATIYVLRATIYRTDQQYDRAVDDLTRAIELLTGLATNDVVASAYVTRASVHALKGDIASAAADYRHALTLDPTNTQAEAGLEKAGANSSAPPDRSRIGRAIPNEPLPPDIPISSDVLTLVQTHPFFSNAPPVRVTAYSTTFDFKLTMSQFNLPSSTQDDTDVSPRWLRAGIAWSDQVSRSRFVIASGTTQSSSESLSISVLNGLIALGSHTFTHSSNRYGNGDGQGFMKTVSISKLVGNVFPLELGKRFSYEIRQRTQGAAGGIHTDSETTDSLQCEVMRRFDARSFHPDLTGTAFFVQCGQQITNNKFKQANSTGQWRSTFFNDLGYWISADPTAPREQIMFNNSVSKTGENVSVVDGVASLRSLSTAW
jgi:hypothetical protein